MLELFNAALPAKPTPKPRRSPPPPRPTDGKPEWLKLNGCVVRATYLEPHGRRIGYAVFRGRRMIANIETDPKHPKHPLGYGLAEARAAAIRFAEGRPTRRDHGNSSWDNDEPGPARPDWLAFVKGFPVVAEYRDNGRMAWHPKCRLPIYDLAKGRRPRRKAKVVAKPPRFVQVTERATCGHLLITTLPAARTPALARVGMSVSYCDIGRSDCGVITEARADGALVHGCEGDVVFLKWCDVSLTGVRPDPTYIVDRAEGTSSRPARARR